MTLSATRAMIVAWLLLAASGVARAQNCNFTTSNIGFGNVSTISGAPTDAAGTVAVSCSGFSTANVRLCLSLGGAYSNRILVGPSSAKLTFEIYIDASRQTVWGTVFSSGQTIYTADLAVTGGTASANLPYYGRVPANQIAALVGSYSMTFDTNSNRYVYVGWSSSAPSCTTTTTPYKTTTFVATASVAADCNITAAPLAFPATGLIDRPLQATSAVQVTCVSGAPYTVALDAGTTPGATVAQRKLTSQNGRQTIGYQLYVDAARTRPWGDGTSGTTQNTGTGTGSQQSFTVYGQVPAQPSQPAGSYTDTITATVSF